MRNWRPIAPAESHPLTDQTANARLQAYESAVKGAFDRIVPVLKRLSALQHEDGFVAEAQRHAEAELGFTLPESILEKAWGQPARHALPVRLVRV